MPELQNRIEADFRQLGWTIAEPAGHNERPHLFQAELAGAGPRFRLFVHPLPAAGPWLLYRLPAKTIARPEPLAGILPLALSTCNLPFRTQAFVRTNERTTFQYVDQGIATQSRRDLRPVLLPAAHRLRRSFLETYLTALQSAGTGDQNLFYLNLLVTDAPLLTLHPQEVEAALATDAPAALGWEASFVPLHLPPAVLGLSGEAVKKSEALFPGKAPLFHARLRYLLLQTPAIYWLVAEQHLVESLRFILSYASRWHSLVL